MQGPREEHIRGAVGGAAEGHEAAGQVADPGLLLAREPAELVLDQFDPSAGRNPP